MLPLCWEQNRKCNFINKEKLIEENPLTIVFETFDKWKHSWFFGLTYNFASLSLGK